MLMQLKHGNMYQKLLCFYLILILIYLIVTIHFYFTENDVMSLFPKKPIYLYFIKWICAMLMIVGIVRINKQPFFCKILLNVVSVCVLIQCYNLFSYYVSIFDVFLLEIVSVALIFTINRKYFVKFMNGKFRS